MSRFLSAFLGNNPLNGLQVSREDRGARETSGVLNFFQLEMISRANKVPYFGVCVLNLDSMSVRFFLCSIVWVSTIDLSTPDSDQKRHPCKFQSHLCK